MICKIVNPKRLTVGDSIRLHRDELLTIDKIEDKKVYLTNSETGEKVEVVFINRLPNHIVIECITRTRRMTYAVTKLLVAV